MPFIRHLRDKRGYETTLVMHAYRPTQGPQRTRVLYLFRSPASLKLGRRPLDEESREALEHTHPDVSFDWIGLDREAASMRRDEQPRERDRYQRPRSGGQRPAGPRPEPVRVVVEDATLLGTIVGGEAARALRRGHAELLERIARRARTPEERDRLTERAQRLNPDEWADEAAIRAMAPTAEADRQAIVAELPARRRGRRGGRRQEGRAGGGESAIMAEDGDIDAHEDESAAQDDPHGEGGIRRSSAGDDHGEPAAAGPESTGGGAGTAGHGLSVDDERGSH